MQRLMDVINKMAKKINDANKIIEEQHKQIVQLKAALENRR